ncbi:hypothetical protein H2200_007158 [Cladophialophora chaetospira]|uniref:DNA2/NAM7 helicase helicase domain-containing protein n=1 Tax=Cladophialophora chaetospira TaxID=386627 RepID=A0AA39CHF4_9EURO|nr:hypothetical protein H2200_007158 [Cladophialophora chaetospira]
MYKTDMHIADEEMPACTALVIHSPETPICAILQNEADFDGRLFQAPLREEAFIEPDMGNPTAEMATEAVIEAGLVHEDDQVTDALLRLRAIDGRRVSPVGQFTNIYLRNKPLTKKLETPHTVDFNGPLSMANPAQRQCIQAAHDEPLSIIHGPPGTAKTYTIVFIVESFLVRF